MADSLPSDLAQFVRQELAVGHYQSLEEIVCDSLRLLRSRQERLQELRQELQPALDELDRGGGMVVKYDDLRAFFEKIVAEVKTEMGLQEPSGR